MRKLTPFLITASLIHHSIASAAPNPELTQYFAEEIARVQEAVDRDSSPDLSRSEADESWYLRRFGLRLRARSAFKVPGLVRFEIVPETELIWDRALPEGTEPYKP